MKKEELVSITTKNFKRSRKIASVYSRKTFFFILVPIFSIIGFIAVRELVNLRLMSALIFAIVLMILTLLLMPQYPFIFFYRSLFYKGRYKLFRQDKVITFKQLKKLNKRGGK